VSQQARVPSVRKRAFVGGRLAIVPVAGEILCRSVAPFILKGEESPDNTEQRTSETEDVREGIEVEKKITACIVCQGLPWPLQARVRRQGKSLPVMVVTP
jgi:hypothetical protein